MSDVFQKTCKFCNKPFESAKVNRLYCSKACSNKHYKALIANNGVEPEHPTVIRQCVTCGKLTVFPVNQIRLYCSRECEQWVNKNDGLNITTVHGEGYKFVKYTPKKDVNKSLDEAVAEAKRLGISYGQYQALQMAGV